MKIEYGTLQYLQFDHLVYREALWVDGVLTPVLNGCHMPWQPSSLFLAKTAAQRLADNNPGSTVTERKQS